VTEPPLTEPPPADDGHGKPDKSEKDKGNPKQ
jgi:hypothetical protein